MLDLIFTRIISWLCIIGGIAAASYGIFAVIIGEVIVESRAMGASVYSANLHASPFYGFVAFYILCGLILIALGFSAKKRK